MERLQFLRGKGDVTLDDVLAPDLLAGVRIVRMKRDPRRSKGFQMRVAGSSLNTRAAGRYGCWSSSLSYAGAPWTRGCQTWCRRIDFVRVVAGDR